MKSFLMIVLVAVGLSSLAVGEGHDHHDGPHGVSRVVLDPGASATVHALDDIHVVCRAGGQGPGSATRLGVELFATESCGGTGPSWTVREVAGCGLQGRPDFYCRSYRSVYSNGTRGPCTSGAGIEEDACCRAAFNGI